MTGIETVPLSIISMRLVKLYEHLFQHKRNKSESQLYIQMQIGPSNFDLLIFVY